MKIAMNNSFLSSSRCRLALRGLVLGCAGLLLASASAQTLQNPGFESPLDPWDPTGLTGGKTNWTILYLSGCPNDFAMKDRSRVSAHAGGCGAHLRPATEFWCHACFTQTVSNLTHGASYVVSGWLKEDFANTHGHLYIETLGGPAGTTSVVSSDFLDVASAGNWSQLSVVNTASSTGILTIRLHLNKDQTAIALPGDAKYYLFDAYFDDITLTPQ